MEIDNTITPDADESKAFWGNSWDNPVDYNSGADWLKEVEERVSVVQKQHDIVIKQLRKIANWKAPGPDGLQGFWLKSFTSCIERIDLQLQDCLTTFQIPEWFTIGRTTLILKDKEKGNIASNFRPITCLPLMWKLCIGIMGDGLYNHLEEKRLLPEEQKGCRKKSRGTRDQLLIDKMVISNCKRRQTGRLQKGL